VCCGVQRAEDQRGPEALTENEVTQSDVDALCNKIRAEAIASGYFLNPDEEFTRDLISSLIINDRRYGYPSCPCRLAEGTRDGDGDIICPCDYRDPDVAEYGACFCALYVSQAASKGEKTVGTIPERRPSPEGRLNSKDELGGPTPALSHPVWRCRVCGYLCARDEPPEICPICKVKKDRFERFM
jgi:ferredoxin-thioredoxin reductase catalytic chain